MVEFGKLSRDRNATEMGGAESHILTLRKELALY